MTENQDLIRVDRERDTRDAFGAIAIAFGLTLLAISAGSSWVHTGDSGDFGTLFIVSVSITFLITIVNLGRPRLLTGSIVQAFSAFATMLSALVFTFVHDDRAIGPAALSALFGGLLVALGGISRINGESIDEIVDETTASGGGGRKWVYRNNRVVAVEQWVDGKLVSTETVKPTIVR